MEAIKKIIIPFKFNRLVPLEFLDFFLPNIKTRFISKNLQDWSSQNIAEYSPSKYDYHKIFKDAKEYAI